MVVRSVSTNVAARTQVRLILAGKTGRVFALRG
jgi:hypothetical protein